MDAEASYQLPEPWEEAREMMVVPWEEAWAEQVVQILVLEVAWLAQDHPLGRKAPAAEAAQVLPLVEAELERVVVQEGYR